MVKNPPAMQETWVPSLDREDPLEKGMTTHSNILARKIPWISSLVGYSPWGRKELGHNWTTDTLVIKRLSIQSLLLALSSMFWAHLRGLLWRDLILLFVQLLNCVWLCNPKDCNSPGLLFLTISWSLLKLTSIESVMLSNQSRPLLPPSPPALNLSQHQGLFQWVGSLHQVAELLDLLQLQHQSFQWTVRVDFP